MRGLRFRLCRAGVPLCMALSAAVPRAIAAPRSVLLVHSGNYPEIEQIRAELNTLDFQVMTLNNHEPSSSSDDLVQWAQENLASVAIEFVVVGDVLRVWSYDTVAGPPPKSQEFHYSATSGDFEGVVALQVVEYLRATLIPGQARSSTLRRDSASPIATAVVSSESSQVALPPPSPIESSALAAVPPSRANPQRLQAPLMPRPHSVWLSLAAGAVVMNQLKQWTPTLESGLAWQMLPELGLSLLGSVPFSPATLASDVGTSKLQTWGTRAAVNYHFANRSSRFYPTLGAGFAMFWLVVPADPPLRADNWIVVAPMPTIEVGVHWQARSRWALTSSLLVGPTLWVQDKVKERWPEARELGRPAIFFVTAGVEWRAVAWGSRD